MNFMCLARLACAAAAELDACRLGRPAAMTQLRLLAVALRDAFSGEPLLTDVILLARALDGWWPGKLEEIADVRVAAVEAGAALERAAQYGCHDKSLVDFCLKLSREAACSLPFRDEWRYAGVAS